METNKRLASLDILRGLDLFLLLAAGPVLHAFLNANPSPAWDGVRHQLSHVSWEGFVLWDIIMPLFMFMSGATIPFSMAKYQDFRPGKELSNVLKAQDGGQRTFSLCQKNLAIPGISYFPLETFLQKDTISDGERSAFFHSAEKKPSMQFPKETFEAALRRFARDVSEIRALCSKKTVSLRDFSRVETAAALLFATEAQFEKLKKEPLEIFCAELKKAADAMQKNLDVC